MSKTGEKRHSCVILNGAENRFAIHGVVKNPAMDCSKEHSTYHHGILHCAFIAFAIKAPFRMTRKPYAPSLD